MSEWLAELGRELGMLPAAAWALLFGAACCFVAAFLLRERGPRG